MKNITLITLLFSAFTFGQYLDQEQVEQSENNNNTFFSENENAATDSEYDLYSRAPAPGDELPIDDWAFLLPLAGLAVGVYYIRRKKAMASKA